ncbi:MAG: right-handed parallel beta-helix repeat-containing protein, partial [Candidatus Paceibacterota bacterium]
EKEFDLEGKKDKATVQGDLEKKSTQLELVLRDLVGHKKRASQTVILDQKAPDLDVNINTKTKLNACNGKPITNKDQVPLRISARDSNFAYVELEDEKLDCTKENDYHICKTKADLNSGKNKKSVTAVDKAGNESKGYQRLIFDKQNPSVELAGELSPSTAKSEIVIPLKFTDDWCLNQVVIESDKLDLNKTVNLEGEEQGIEPKISLEDLEKQITQQDGVSEIEAEIQFKPEDNAGNIVDVDECDACTKTVKYSPGIINKDTDETYSDLHKAVNSANPGNTIQIGEMDVTGNIEIKKELTLTGLGADKTTLESAKMGVPVLEIKGLPSGVTIKNLHVKSKRSECLNSQKDICPYAISIRGKSKVNIINSVLSNSSMAAVKVSGESQVEVSSSELTRSKHGLVAAESSKTSLTDTTINNNTSHGIVIRNNSIAKINDCLISDNSGAGIRIESPEEQTVMDSEIKKNSYGVVLTSDAALLLEGNKFCTNDQYDLATFSKECGFDREAEEFSGEIKNQKNLTCKEGDNDKLSACPYNILKE